MNTIKINRKFVLQNTMFFLFCLLIFAIPFNTRKIYYSQYTFFSGYLNEFLSYSLYLTDFIVAIMIVACMYISRNNIYQLLWKDIKLKINSLMVIFLAWIFIGAIVKPEYFDISLYSIARIALCIAVAFMIKYVINTKKKHYISLLAISVAGTIQGIIAIFQFIFQSSIFGTGLMHKITGESLIATDIIGTSNIIYYGEKIIRAYGTFPHPNILAGFLLITVLISIYIYSIRKEILKNIKIDGNTKTWKCQGLSFTQLIQLSVAIQLIGLIVTFSRSALIALLIVVFINIFVFKIVSRETIYVLISKITAKWSLLNIIHRIFFVCILLFVILVPAVIFVKRMQSEFLGHQSFQDRILLENVSRETIIDHPLFGIGIGAYVLNLRDTYSHENLSYWQFQPDHNEYTLIAAEIGVVGLIIYLYMIISLCNGISTAWRKSSSFAETKSYYILLKSIMITILLLGLFDHYFWTSNQMRLFQWVIVGYILAQIGESRHSLNARKILIG